MKHVKKVLSWILVVSLLITNVEYVQATREAAVKQEEIVIESVSSSDVTAGDVFTGEQSVEELPMGEITGGDVTTGDITTGDVTTGDVSSNEPPVIEVTSGDVVKTTAAEEVTVVVEGPDQYGVKGKITSDGVLYIYGEKTPGSTGAVTHWWKKYKTYYNKVVITAKNVTNTASWFEECDNITEIDMSGFDTSMVTYMAGTFQDCTNLKKIDMSNCDTSNVHSMTYMFAGCSSLTSLDLSDLDTSNVTDMYNMFDNCSSLTSVDLSSFDTSKAEDIAFMFADCSSLTSLDLSNFDTSKVIHMGGMFDGCSSLTSLDLSNFDTSNTTSMGLMFRGCSSLTSLDLSYFDTSKVTGMSAMFSGCSKLQNLDISSFDTSQVQRMGEMFYGCESLTELDVDDFDTSNVTYMREMFRNCYNLEELDIDNFDTSKVTTMEGMFRNCQKVKKLDVTYFDTSNVTSMFQMFRGCENLEGLNFMWWDTAKVENFSEMFYGCDNLTVLDVSEFDTSSAKKMYSMFASCDKLTVLDVSVFDVSKVTEIEDMFKWCSGLTRLKLFPNLQSEIKLPITMYASGTAYTTCPTGLTDSMWLYSTNDKYTVRFSPENGDILGVTEYANLSAGVTVPLPEDPINMGYVFSGWYTGQGGTGIKFTADTVINRDYYLHAYWVPVELTAMEFVYATYTLTESDTNKLSIRFTPRDAMVSWSKTLQWTSSNPAVATVAQGGTVTAVKKGVATITATAPNGVTAQCTINVMGAPRTVTFDDDLGGTPIQIANITDGTTITLPAAPTRTGYIFDGWFTERNGQGIELTADTIIEKDWYVYASWYPDGLWATEVAPQTYTGKAIKPVVQVYDGKTLLAEKTDYTISYKNNVKASDASNAKKAPTITVKGKGNYTGTETVTFQILAKDLAETDVTVKEMVAVAGNKVQKPVPTLTYNGKKLKNKTDFTVSYPDLDNPEIVDAYKAPGIYTVRVEGKGNFKGTRDITFTITGGTLMSKVKIAAIPNQPYTGAAIEPEVKVTYNGKNLVKDTDYTVAYKNNVKVGKATVVVTGMGDYAGTKEATFQITGISIAKAKVNGIVNKVYNGTEQTQNLEVVLGGEMLAPSNYTVSYSKNVNVGTASVVITGSGSYTGSVKKTFKITAYDLQADTDKLVSGIVENLTVIYTKGGSTPTLDLSFGATALKDKQDYTISYSNNKKVATAMDKKAPTIKIKGKGNFKGTITVPFNIVAKDLMDSENPVTINAPDVAYSAKAGKYISKPVLTDSNGKKLVAGTDYEKTIAYTLADGTVLNSKKDAPEAGTVIKVTVTGKGNYTGTLEAIYKITQASFKSAKIKIDAQVYTGSTVALDPEDITVKVGETELKYGEDYVIVEDSYKNNVKKGNASVTIKGIGNYGGEKTVKFKIASKKMVWFWNLF